MNRLDQDRLLNEVLNGEELAPLREASLAQGLAFLARRRRRRKMAQAAVLGVAILMAIGGVLARRSLWQVARQLAHLELRPADLPAVTQPNTRTVELITEDELFALLPHRSLALIGKPGHQQLICLDEHAGGANVKRTIGQ